MTDIQKWNEFNIEKIVASNNYPVEYKDMVVSINSNMPMILQNSENFYKTSSQFKNAILDVTDITPISSLKHILAVIDQTKKALEEAQFAMKKKLIELNKKNNQLERIVDIYDRELLEVEIQEILLGKENGDRLVRGAIRKLNYFVTQYNSILNFLGKDFITEEEFEQAEVRHHIMTAMKQALISARPRNGLIDEGNQIYLFDLGINGTAAQMEILGYLQMEEEMVKRGEEPTHQMTIDWLNLCADKFAKAPEEFAMRKGFKLLDETSLVRELTNEKSN